MKTLDLMNVRFTLTNDGKLEILSRVKIQTECRYVDSDYPIRLDASETRQLVKMLHGGCLEAEAENVVRRVMLGECVKKAIDDTSYICNPQPT